LNIRGDSTSCPLAFGLDTYYNCDFDCLYCCFLGLNAVWGKDFRTLDIDWFKKRILNGIKNKSPRSPLAWAIHHRKTLRIGNKYDPLPPMERELRTTLTVLEFLKSLNWEVKLESKNTDIMLEYQDVLVDMGAIITTTVLSGLEKDWELLEGKRPPPPRDRLDALMEFKSRGCQVAVVTEPFIPGYHMISQFDELMGELEARGIDRANVYNLRMTPFVMKRFAEADMDIELIWEMSQDWSWKEILMELLEVGEKRGIKLGCPDFVNAGKFHAQTNTCCGVDVSNPCTFNIVNWRNIGVRKGFITVEDLKETYDGVGDWIEGLDLFMGDDDKKYTLADTGMFERDFNTWTLV